VEAGSLSGPLEDAIGRLGIDLVGCIPVDKNILEYDQTGRALMDLPDDSAAVTAVDQIMERLAI
jgi:CO dehydrogenase maturation factor